MYKNTPQNNKGFTLIEFIVVLVIFSVMSTVSIFNYGDYRKSIEETNVTQDVALTIRQAQVYGLSSSDKIVGSDIIDPETLFLNNQSVEDITQDRSVRGVSIDSLTETIIIFEDINRNFIYDSGTDRMIDQRSIITENVDIIGVDLCDVTPNCDFIQTTRVDIVFQRPYPDAYISLNGGYPTTYDYASILIGDASSYDKYVQISSIGSISVKKDYE